MENQKFEKIDNGDPDFDIMTIEEWIRAVETGCFIDYDGHGNLATKDEILKNFLVKPSYVVDGKIKFISGYFSTVQPL